MSRSRRTTVIRHSYQVGGITLSVGDPFRVAGCRKIYRFSRYVERGATEKVIEATGPNGEHRDFYVGRRPIEIAVGMRLAPYRVQPLARQQKTARAVARAGRGSGRGVDRHRAFRPASPAPQLSQPAQSAQPQSPETEESE